MHEDICHAMLGYPLDRVRVLDTETTGTDTSSDEVLSVAISDGNGRELLNTYVHPTRHTTWPDAQRVHGISPSMVAGAPTIGDVAESIRGLLDGDVMLVGYNISFDIRMLQSGGALPSVLPMDTYDVMREYARVHGERRWEDSGRWKWSKLTECARHYGYAFAAHDAMEDVRATAFCLRALLCDAEYVACVRESRDAPRGLSTTQTKATMGAIAELLGDHKYVTTDGTVRVGEVTRGRTAGTKRLECHVGDACVGIVTKSAERRVLASVGCASPAEMDVELPATVTVSGTDGRRSCTFDLDLSAFDAEVDGLAASERGRLEMDRMTQAKRAAAGRVERMRTARPEPTERPRGEAGLDGRRAEMAAEVRGTEQARQADDERARDVVVWVTIIMVILAILLIGSAHS